jgi:divalent metal cation (Fe/Co/Zn/Cd) transporter
LLEYVTISYNVGEAVLSIAAGLLAGSIALLAFGFDSTIEVAAAVFVAWRLRAEVRARHLDHTATERRAHRAVGVTFVVLGVYIVMESARSLAGADPPAPSPLGIGVAVASLVLMPSLALAKVRLARRLGSASLEADARETIVCAYLSAMLLVGLGLNAAFGLWWADHVGGLLMAPFVFYSAWDSFREPAGGPSAVPADP